MSKVIDGCSCCNTCSKCPAGTPWTVLVDLGSWAAGCVPGGQFELGWTGETNTSCTWAQRIYVCDDGTWRTTINIRAAVINDHDLGTRTYTVILDVSFGPSDGSVGGASCFGYLWRSAPEDIANDCRGTHTCAWDDDEVFPQTCACCEGQVPVETVTLTI